MSMEGAETMSKYCFGIDIGGTSIKCGLFNIEGELRNNFV